MTATRIWTDLDLDPTSDCRQQGYLRLPISSNESGAGWLPIPIVVFKNGEGPSVLLQAGNHGDEFDGQVMLIKLIRELKLEDVSGRIYILPGVNAPAVKAGGRLSPLDGGNLNRSFPGDPNGTPTPMIAHFLETVILPKVDHVFDFHSGGASSEFIPMAHTALSSDPQKRRQVLEFFQVFGMENSSAVEGLIGGDLRFLGACARAGVTHMSTELGGAAVVSPDVLEAAEHGVRRLLHHLGVVRRPLTDVPAPATRFWRRLPQRDYVFSSAVGIFEPIARLGQEVHAGDLAARIHSTDHPWDAPTEIRFAVDRTVLAQRTLARCEIGDYLYALGVPADVGQLRQQRS